MAWLTIAAPRAVLSTNREAGHLAKMTVAMSTAISMTALNRMRTSDQERSQVVSGGSGAISAAAALAPATRSGARVEANASRGTMLASPDQAEHTSSRQALTRNV